VRGTRFEAEVTVKSYLELLNVKVPRNAYAPGCSLNVYGPACGVSKASKTVTGTVAGSSGRAQLDSALAQADGYFDLGTLTITSGANAGLSRTVRSYAGGSFDLILAFPNDIENGATFSVFPGCDKTRATCIARFNNLGRFTGTPFIPAPETIT
jgi:uncharacterized phage protein (TIGR02218 family)